MTELCTLHGIPDCTSCWLEEHRDATTADYIRAEAERLPNGTAAKFLAAIKPDTVTITISREAAEQMARTYQIYADEYDASYLDNIARACRAALNLSEGTEEEA